MSDETATEQRTWTRPDTELTLSFCCATDIVVVDRTGAADSMSATGLMVSGIPSCDLWLHAGETSLSGSPGGDATLVYCGGDIAMPLELRLKWLERGEISAFWSEQGTTRCAAVEDNIPNEPAVQRWRIELLRTTADDCSLAIVRIDDE